MKYLITTAPMYDDPKYPLQSLYCTAEGIFRDLIIATIPAHEINWPIKIKEGNGNILATINLVPESSAADPVYICKLSRKEHCDHRENGTIYQTCSLHLTTPRASCTYAADTEI